MPYTPKTQTIYSNYRIEVQLENPWFYNHKTPEENHVSMLRDLEDLRIAANRHLEYHAGISSHYDREVSCKFCGDTWDDAVDDDGVPWCCQEAQDDYEAQTGLTIQDGARHADVR